MSAPIPVYAILIVFPDGHIHLNVHRPRWAAFYPPSRQRTYRRISTASLRRLDTLIQRYASYTGTTQTDNAFVAMLDLPGCSTAG